MTEWSHTALTPTGFLERAAAAHAGRVAIIDGENTWTYRSMLDAASAMAGTLRTLAGFRPVAVLAPNTAGMLLVHFAIPWAGVPMVPLNTRLAPTELAALLEHSRCSVLLYDPVFEELATTALAHLTSPPQPVMLSTSAGAINPELLTGRPGRVEVSDENALLSINYTSGTTGKPKGVMYSHRGAYLQALAMTAQLHLDTRTSYLWTLPMFHCHGWCFPWAVTAVAGTHVCLPKVDAAQIWHSIATHGITHLNGAPTVLTLIADAAQAHPLAQPIRVATGGAPPSPALLRRMTSLGFDLTHLYGLTETYGPAVICDWRPEWDAEDPGRKAELHARQGVGNVVSQPPRVIDALGRDVPSDGSTIGEIALRGNNVMLGYYKDPGATRDAIRDGWFRTGDLGVRHPDGYIELRDRSKDVIISGGENITSVEVENVIAEHPGVAEVAVVGMADEKWGEVPVAFITIRDPDNHMVSEADIIDRVRGQLARYKAPKRVVIVDDLPKTSTGKIQKHLLRNNNG
ncbi:AMP-binding protein [Gordonia terrae]|uniref:AMP-binding protein n=1 Tax=Gordonia terrae TaxID=2055 RepID=UPI003F6C9F28